MASLSPRGVHFVGSVPLDTSDEVFRLLATTLPEHITQIPDGEPSERSLFVKFQRDVFLGCPGLLNNPNSSSDSEAPLLDTQSQEVQDFLANLETGYDTAAVASYARFRTLRDDQGIIPRGVRFQVSIPTPLNTLNAWIAPKHKALVAPHYTAALHRAVANVQAEIPPGDLCVQIDCAHEFGMLEGVYYGYPRTNANANADPSLSRLRPPPLTPWWDGDIASGVVDRVVAFAEGARFHPDVHLGFHLCYGDFGHKHFVEPKDAGLLVYVAREILTRVPRKVQYIHMPVPRERDDEAYFAPLRDLVPLLKRTGTKLFLGLVREADLEGTKRRIETAKRVLASALDGDDGLDWGVASECGLGRTPREEVPGILDIVKTVSLPLS